MTQTASAAASATIPPLCLNAFNGSAFLGEKENLRGWIDGAAAAGMPLLGPDAFTLGQWTEQGHTLPALAQHMRDAGVGCGTIAASAMLDGGPHALPMLMQAADAADALGARFLQVNMDGTGHAARQAALEQAVTALDGRGLTLAIEYMPQTGLNSVSETVALARHVGTDKAGAMIDIWHHSHGPDDWDALTAVPLDAIAYIELDDALPDPGDDLIHEMINRRTFPGEGRFDVPRFLSIMAGKGYSGMVSVEVLNAEWRERPVADFARHCQKSSAAFWQAPSSA